MPEKHKTAPNPNPTRTALKAGTQITVGGNVYTISKEPTTDDVREQESGTYHLEMHLKKSK